MTRFFLTLPEAISLLFKAIDISIGGEIFVMNMPSFSINLIAQALISIYGNDKTIVEEIGIREGEKLDEVLISEHESCRAHIIDKDYFVIYPDLNTDRSFNLQLPKVNFKIFSSEDINTKTDILNIFNLLTKGGY
jgi:UDP-N-acetylglucosamine 4,6-dehydratase/5-epimerase